MHAGAPEWIDRHVDAGAADRGKIDDRLEIRDVGAEVIVFVRRGCLLRLRRQQAADSVQTAFEQDIGAVLDPVRDQGVGGGHRSVGCT